MNLDRFQPARSKLEKGKIEVVVGEASSTHTSIPTHITTAKADPRSWKSNRMIAGEYALEDKPHEDPECSNDNRP